MNPLLKKYRKEIIPQMKEKFGYKNDLAVPCLEKITLNIGLGSGLKDAKFIEDTENTLQRISGQKPVKTLSKKSIAGFKIREGMIIGLKVTLRKSRMYDFVYKLINIVFPRVRDFWGLNPNSVDKQGNLSIGFKEHIVFPEIRPDVIERLHGLEVVITTTAKDKDEGLELLKLFGFPFKES